MPEPRHDSSLHELPDLFFRDLFSRSWAYPLCEFQGTSNPWAYIWRPYYSLSCIIRWLFWEISTIFIEYLTMFLQGSRVLNGIDMVPSFLAFRETEYWRVSMKRLIKVGKAKEDTNKPQRICLGLGITTSLPQQKWLLFWDRRVWRCYSVMKGKENLRDRGPRMWRPMRGRNDSGAEESSRPGAERGIRGWHTRCCLCISIMAMRIQ